MKRKLWLALAVACLLLPAVAFGASGLWEASLIYTDNNTVTLAWDASTSTCMTGKYCGYEIEMRHLEIITFIDRYTVQNLAQTQAIIPYKKSGHYKSYIRSVQCEDAILKLNCAYSEWTDSMANGMIVIGVPEPVARPWLLYWRLPAPTNGGIE